MDCIQERVVRMRNTYEEYLREPKTLTFEQMRELHTEIAKETDGDPDALELYGELMESAAAYASIRSRWLRMSREEKMKQDSLRTSAHDSVIIHFNMLARYLRMQGKKAEWRERLGYEEDDPYYRKTIGDFGCYLVFIDSICAR